MERTIAAPVRYTTDVSSLLKAAIPLSIADVVAGLAQPLLATEPNASSNPKRSFALKYRMFHTLFAMIWVATRNHAIHGHQSRSALDGRSPQFVSVSV